jgi:hypothetical protein
MVTYISTGASRLHADIGGGGGGAEPAPMYAAWVEIDRFGSGEACDRSVDMKSDLIPKIWGPRCFEIT